MTDLEKVIQGLECCLEDKNDDCGWQDGDNKKCPYNETVDGCVGRMMKDCLEILKGRTTTVDTGIDVPSMFHCHDCHAAVAFQQKFCHCCGRLINWGELNGKA